MVCSAPIALLGLILGDYIDKTLVDDPADFQYKQTTLQSTRTSFLACGLSIALETGTTIISAPIHPPGAKFTGNIDKTYIYKL